jgi:arylsulfatase A-like enzyme
MCALDDAVGATLDAVRDAGVEQNTLVFFISDNGGPVGERGNGSSNGPLRQGKGTVFEGGVRVPFLVSWPAKLPQGKEYDGPVIQLDIFATAAAVSGAKLPDGLKLDGVNLIPHLAGEKAGGPHDRLYWRTGGGEQLAIRAGDWKWVRQGQGPAMLFNLREDLGEARDVIATHHERAKELEAAALAWNSELVAPLFENPNRKRLQR